jgi:hypothetical protein
MSWMGKTSEAIEAMASLEMMTKVSLLALMVSPSAMLSVPETDM